MHRQAIGFPDFSRRRTTVASLPPLSVSPALPFHFQLLAFPTRQCMHHPLLSPLFLYVTHPTLCMLTTVFFFLFCPRFPLRRPLLLLRLLPPCLTAWPPRPQWSCSQRP